MNIYWVSTLVLLVSTIILAANLEHLRRKYVQQRNIATKYRELYLTATEIDDENYAEDLTDAFGRATIKADADQADEQGGES